MDDDEMLSFVMPFGKHKGKQIKKCECSYLKWVIDEVKTRDKLKTILTHFEYDIREGAAYSKEWTLEDQLR